MPDEKPMDVNDPEHVDPVLEELWQIREEMAAEWNYDFDTMLRYFEDRRRLYPVLEKAVSHRDTEAQR